MILVDLIERRGQYDQYPYHVLGTQGLSWARRGIPSSSERQRYLRNLQRVIDSGCNSHPSARELKQIQFDLTKEYLLTAT